MDFKPGDTVRLKSGSPVMTVSKTEDGRVNCVWFSNDDVKSGTFIAAALEQYVEPNMNVRSSY